MAKKKPENLPEYLTPDEERFAWLKVAEGKKLHEVYKALHPKSHMSKANMAKEAWKHWQRIKGKVGSWSEWFEKYDVGPDRLIKVFSDAMEALVYTDVYEKPEGGEAPERVTILAVDHRTRVYAAKELKDIHGLNEQTINVKNEGPIPITYFYEQPRETKEPEPDDETTD